MLFRVTTLTRWRALASGWPLGCHPCVIGMPSLLLADAGSLAVQAQGDALLVYHRQVNNELHSGGAVSVCSVPGQEVVWATQTLMTWRA